MYWRAPRTEPSRRVPTHELREKVVSTLPTQDHRSVPPLASMNRNETLQEIFALEQIAKPGPAAALAIAKLTSELRDLDMPSNWIERSAR